VFEQAYAEAQARRLVSTAGLWAVVCRNGKRPGAGVLSAILDAGAGPALTRSEAEERLLSLIRSAGLPPPETNVRLGAHEVDFLWRSERLIVEVDGFRFHASRAAFERDRLRDAKLLAHGFRVIRVTWRQIVRDPEGTVVRITSALAVGGIG
jgi:very-short-patch-repair endonuclease